MSKTLQIKIPDYLSIEQYLNMNSYKGDSNFGRLVHTVSVITGYDKKEIRSWPLNVLTDLANDMAELADHKNEFHSIIEFDGQLYGYANIKQQTLGEYIDLENLAKDFEANAHKIAALLYRPITKHRFDTIKFMVKQKIKMANNAVENVFDWYSIEKYDNEVRKDREKLFKTFPAHIFLGAINFFLSTASLYSTNILYLENKITKETRDTMMTDQLANLSASTTGGGLLYTNSVSPTYFRLQESLQSLN